LSKGRERSIDYFCQQIFSESITEVLPKNQEFLEEISTMKSKPFNLLLKLLYFLLAFLIVVMPTIMALVNGDLIGIAWLMGAMGLWLVLVGRLRIGNFSLEGKQAFAVGGALLFPLFISTTVHQLGLWPPLTIGAIVVGLFAAIILYFAVKPTAVPKERSLAVVIFLSGLGLTIVGNALDAPSDSSGVILVNGIPLLPVPSMLAFILFLGVAAIVTGLYGLIFGFGQKKK
jgi:hypothetical protein